MSDSIYDMEPGDYVKTTSGRLEKIVSIYGIRTNENGGKYPAKPSEGGFGVVTESGLNVSMWDAKSYHKADTISSDPF